MLLVVCWGRGVGVGGLLVPFAVLLLLLVDTYNGARRKRSGRKRPGRSGGSNAFACRSRAKPIRIPTSPGEIILLSKFAKGMVRLNMGVINISA